MLSSRPIERLRAALAVDFGQTLVEYSLVIALIAMVGLAGVVAVGTDTGALYETVKKAANAIEAVLT